MLLNKREDIHNIIRTIGTEEGVKGIRIYNKQGVIIFSTDSTEINKAVDMKADACVMCHGENSISDKLSQKDSIRIYNIKDERVLGLINPINNEPDCSTADCHAHSPNSKYLGVLDIMLSMKNADEVIAQNKQNIIINSVLITFLISIISGLFILLLINKPIRRLALGMKELGQGNWNFRIRIKSNNELGVIAREFNDMSRKLASAYNEIKDWSETLNEKVEQKTAELKSIYEQVVQIEKLASLGKLSATVAHELNNPLEGILTYSKLISKRLKQTEDGTDYSKLINYLNMIADESSRCGKIVKDLLLFSHRDNEEFTSNDIIYLIEKSLALVNHHFEINNIVLVKDFAFERLEIVCDPQKIQQTLISLLINAVESMSGKGGKITVKLDVEDKNAVIRIIDEGTGISQKDLAHIFEPFFTTKEASNGTGLGLSVVYGIINLHNGEITVEDTSIKGTTFKIILPLKQKEYAKNEN
jgi:two-component system NtrC family sensor kinase